MDALLGFVSIILSLAILAGIIMLFVKRMRKKGVWIALGSFVLLFIIAGVGNNFDENTAKKAGFSNVDEYREAQKVGISTPQEWADYKDKQALAAAKEEQIAAEKEAEDKEKQRVEKEQKEAEAKSQDEACLSDLQCAGDKFSFRATRACRPMIERLAQYDFKWTDGMLGSKFPYFRWNNKEKHIITYIGDAIKLQNGFGAWQQYSYSCDYNFDLDEVVDVNGAPGPLPER